MNRDFDATAKPALSSTRSGDKAGGSSLPIVYFGDIRPALDAADFVEGLLIENAMSVVYGESGSGKTFFVLDLALHVAAGRRWRGREVDRKGVLYLALEGGHGVSNRIAAFRAAHPELPGTLPFAVVPVSLDLLAPDGDTLRVVEAARDAAERLGVPVGMIVIDTLSRAMAGGNENASEDMGALIRNIDLIRQSLPAHIVVVHHSGKDGAKGARGHSSLRAATDAEIEVSRDQTNGTSTARVTKQRDLELVGEFPYRLESVTLGTNRRGKPVTSCVVREVDPVQVQTDAAGLKVLKAKEALRQKLAAEDAAVLDAIDAETGRGFAGATITAIRKTLGWGEPRIRGVLARLEEDFAVRSCEVRKAKGNAAQTKAAGWCRVSIKQQCEIS
ncbi:AAA family ATPase [Frigoriglobus tundricola]|uniref:AAA family ATPase n=1 Tax=Frigoriglobus tundricola TaxID=2774151 RepID=UPI00148EB80D|nr:AAA family ATPase [Frigoriglobus tundricola]